MDNSECCANLSCPAIAIMLYLFSVVHHYITSNEVLGGGILELGCPFDYL
jgi:hypothetical protein